MKGVDLRRMSRGLLGGKKIPVRFRRALLAERIQPPRRKEQNCGGLLGYMLKKKKFIMFPQNFTSNTG